MDEGVRCFFLDCGVLVFTVPPVWGVVGGSSCRLWESMKAYYKLEYDIRWREFHQCSRGLGNFRVPSCQTPSASHSRQMVFSCFQASLSSGSPAVEAGGSLYPRGFCHGGATCREMTFVNVEYPENTCGAGPHAGYI